MKASAGLAVLSLFSFVSQPALAFYIDPAVMQDIRAAKVAERSTSEYIDVATGSSDHLFFQNGPTLRVNEAKTGKRDDQYLEQHLTKRARIGRFMAKFSTVGAKKAVKFSKHHPATATIIVGAIAAKTAYGVLHHDDDHHDHHRKTVIYVNAPTRPPRSRRGSYKETEGELDDDEDDNEEMHLAKRETGPVDSFMSRTIKKGAIGTKKFAKYNPYTAAAVGGTLLTVGAVKLYNAVKSDDHDTQVVRLVKRGLAEDERIERSGGKVDDTVLGKRGPPQKLSTTERAKAFVKTKKGKVIVGGMGVKAAMTIGFLYYMHNKDAKPAQMSARPSPLHRKRLSFKQGASNQAPVYHAIVNQALRSAPKEDPIFGEAAESDPKQDVVEEHPIIAQTED
jgi:hypothetical protein